MKNIICGALLLLACGSAPSWAQPGQPRVFATEPFDTIEISGAADVRFTQGSTDQVTVRSGGDDVRDKVFEVRDRKLRIGLSGAWRFWDSDKMRIEVQARDLTRVTISGAGDFRAPTSMRVGQLVVLISGAGSARFDQLSAETLSFQIAGAGDGHVAGSTKDLTLKISGHGEFRGEDLRSERADVSVSGVGEARIWAVQELRIAVSGAAQIDYWGAPTVKRSVSGAAKVIERGSKSAR
ncbi:MAG: DUF2807 domain-containing protein [Burkholderiaceae bacterium]|nr:DUF2807 domain-containing protein [Burkholderiaceae bacterium]